MENSFEKGRSFDSNPLGKTKLGKTLNRIEQIHDARPESLDSDAVREFPEVATSDLDEELLIHSSLNRDEQVKFLEARAQFFQSRIQQIAEIREIDSSRMAELQNIIDQFMQGEDMAHSIPLKKLQDDYEKLKQAIQDADDSIMQLNEAYQKVTDYKRNIEPGTIEYN